MAENIKVLNEFIPKAEQARFGGIKVGETLTIDSTGVLNTNAENTGVGGNRLTYIPRHFVLNISSGTVTLPSGSELYIPNGFEADETTPKFTKLTTTQTITKVAGGASDGRYDLLLDLEFGTVGGLRIRPVSNCISGSIAPSTSGSWAWYDTANNLMKIYDSTTLMSSTNSLPLGQVTVESGVITKINVIFSDTGYIGGMVFALPGIRGSIPYSMPASDLSPQSLNFETTRVLTAQVPSIPMTTMRIYMNATSIIISKDYFYDGNSNRNRQISNTNNILNAAETNGWVYCNTVDVISSFQRAFIEATEYQAYYEQTMPWNFSALTYLNANNGWALVGQKYPANGAYVPFLRHKSNTGVFLLNGHQDHFEVTWTSDSTIAANSNAITHRVTLLNEAGNTAFPGNVSAGGTINATATSAYWADLAEKYITDKKYPIGTLVAFGGEKEMTIATKKVNGVISEKPGFVLNKKSKGQPIALIGKTKVRVIGIVDKGDKLVLDKDGVARTKRWYDIFKKTIGIALEANIKLEEKLVMSVVKLVI